MIIVECLSGHGRPPKAATSRSVESDTESAFDVEQRDNYTWYTSYILNEM